MIQIRQTAVLLLVAAITFISCEGTSLDSSTNSDLAVDDSFNQTEFELPKDPSVYLTQSEIDELIIKYAEEIKLHKSKTGNVTTLTNLSSSDFTITTLGDISLGQGRVFDINDNNLAIGRYSDGGRFQPTIWENETTTTIPNLNGFGGEAFGMNNNNSVVGFIYKASNYEGFYWTSETSTQRTGLIVPDSEIYYSFSKVNAVNSSNTYVGEATTNTPLGIRNQGFIGSQEDGLTSIIVENSTSTIIADINDNGIAVGSTSQIGAQQAPITYSEEDGITIRSVDSYTSSFFTAINNNNVIVGWGFGAQVNPGFLIDDSGNITLIEPATELNCTSNCTVIPEDINDNNTVVGKIRVPGGFINAELPFLWTEEEGMIILPQLNPNGFININSATSINNNGVIGGFSFNNSFREIPVLWASEDFSGPSNTAPIANAGSDQSVTATAQTTPVTLTGSGTDVDGDNLTYSWTLDGNVVSTDATFTTDLADGSYTFTLTVSDGEESSSDEVSISVINTIPVANAGSDFTTEATGQTTEVTLTGSGTDADGDALTYSWSNGSTDKVTNVNLGVGSHTFTLTVSDIQGASSSDEVIITITDTTAPDLTFTTQSNSLWPPNHKMILVLSGISATDIVDGATNVDISVTSNEDVNGRGDGNTDEDYDISANLDGTYDVYLRAERAGGGNGRVYTITLYTTDSAGNNSGETIEVSVAENQGNGKGKKKKK